MSETHQVIYRKYRPQRFEDVVGEDHIVEALRRAVAAGKVGHAYIFSGPRGTGKTTLARILAKAVNCEKEGKEAPCERCASCKEFLDGRAMDLIEIDAASTRGIDEIRRLRDEVPFAPYRKRKVYVLDEAHMLTKEAWNAFLKTFEEPPAHAMFILATTDLEKVPDTIRSRAEEFQFRRLPAAVIEKRLLKIAKHEDVAIEKEAVRLLALLAEGSLRDAESMLGQAFASAGKNTSADDVTLLFGLPPAASVARFVQSVVENDALGALTTLEGVVTEGIDPRTFSKFVIEDLRVTLLLAIDPKIAANFAADYSPERITFLTGLAKKSNPDRLRIILLAFLEAHHSPYVGVLSHIPLELAVVKACERGAIS